jgi:hypothetical protein
MTQAFNLSQLANNLNSSGQLDATDGLVNALPVVNGGTGASTASAARTNLGLDYATIAAQIYPVGSIYTNATNATNPATLLGFGTWSAFGSARVLVGDGGGFAAGATGGSADAITVAHTHTASTTISDPGHNHATGVNSEYFPYGVNVARYGYGAGWTSVFTRNATGGTGYETITSSNATGVTAATTVTSTGASATNANLQPYIVVYMWVRTA